MSMLPIQSFAQINRIQYAHCHFPHSLRWALRIRRKGKARKNLMYTVKLITKNTDHTDSFGGTEYTEFRAELKKY